MNPKFETKKIMPSLRKEFTDSQKAHIFKRDRATCCFSGANLWLLDSPLRYTWESDWADHVRPASHGGKSEIPNGVCASATFNVKKRNNSADTSYLFQEGVPTPLFFAIHGTPSASLTERLKRLSHLKDEDWFFNRMVEKTFQALHYLCWSDKWEKLPTRNDTYWLKAAFKKCGEFRKHGGTATSIVERDLVKNPTNLQQQLLSLSDCVTFDAFRKKALKLCPEFNRNSKIWNKYFTPNDYEDDPARHDAHRKKTYQQAVRDQSRLSGDTFDCIHVDFTARFGAD